MTKHPQLPLYSLGGGRPQTRGYHATDNVELVQSEDRIYWWFTRLLASFYYSSALSLTVCQCLHKIGFGVDLTINLTIRRHNLLVIHHPPRFLLLFIITISVFTKKSFAVDLITIWVHNLLVIHQAPRWWSLFLIFVFLCWSSVSAPK